MEPLQVSDCFLVMAVNDVDLCLCNDQCCQTREELGCPIELVYSLQKQVIMCCW